MFKQHE
jgi:hypothetical protein